MTLSLKSKVSLCVVAVLLALCAVTAVAMFTRPAQAPAISGVLVPNANPLQEFALVDHHNRAFTRADLLGQWHIVSYGFTHCPDVCPTTLMTLAGVARLIEKDQAYTDVRFLFYTVDPERDTPGRLAEYVPWFHKDFVGLTHPDVENPDLAFEQNLGMVSMIDPFEKIEGVEDFGGYSVSHGLMIYLLNPQGNLQAVLKPTIDEVGTPFFSIDQIYRDYRAIRDYVADPR